MAEGKKNNHNRGRRKSHIKQDVKQRKRKKKNIKSNPQFVGSVRKTKESNNRYREIAYLLGVALFGGIVAGRVLEANATGGPGVEVVTLRTRLETGGKNPANEH
ncbi:uncharacterized protein N7479_001954 [Penicillium vulpinum]|uniref:uncharacterized protein n=1 Tax=Penicillium vulpinum TaxID=29845 RepID=UPI0025475867|nr:uncharacterized protein N7479_001954 [Penicillium vulpinum]KAJ5972036.1 hypothetical protein N7479_001954 [Penicillium vulpinum]